MDIGVVCKMLKIIIRLLHSLSSYICLRSFSREIEAIKHPVNDALAFKCRELNNFCLTLPWARLRKKALNIQSSAFGTLCKWYNSENTFAMMKLIGQLNTFCFTKRCLWFVVLKRETKYFCGEENFYSFALSISFPQVFTLCIPN